MKTFDYRL